MRLVLPRGRLFESAVEVLTRAGINFRKPDGRELIIKNKKHELLLAKPFDVPLYVEKGSDIGISGYITFWKMSFEHCRSGEQKLYRRRFGRKNSGNGISGYS